MIEMKYENVVFQLNKRFPINNILKNVFMITELNKISLIKRSNMEKKTEK